MAQMSQISLDLTCVLYKQRLNNLSRESNVFVTSNNYFKFAAVLHT